MLRADVVICGAGIAGIAAAHELCVRRGLRDVLLVDERPPLSLTSDKSTEAYRNFWPGPDDAMVRLMNRSIDLLEELVRASDNVFRMNRRGYVYATARREHAAALAAAARTAESMGAGALRVHDGTPASPAYVPAPGDGFGEPADGADLFVDAPAIGHWFPYLAPATCAALHVRRCGWFSGQQLGAHLLERARAHGARLLRGRVAEVLLEHDRVAGVRVDLPDGTSTVSTRRFVVAAGPFAAPVAAGLGVRLPVFSELHLKASFADTLGIVPRQAPLLIWDDPQHLPWSGDERTVLGEQTETRWLLEPFPASVHTRPEGGPGSTTVLVLWPYHATPVEERFPIPEDVDFPEVALRGLSTMIPGLGAYFARMPRMFVDGGYYTKTRENRPLVGPLPVEGVSMIGALSGYGLMAACGAAELLGAHVTGSTLPPHAPAFGLERYDDPEYRRRVDAWGATGQL